MQINHYEYPSLIFGGSSAPEIEFVSNRCSFVLGRRITSIYMCNLYIL